MSFRARSISRWMAAFIPRSGGQTTFVGRGGRCMAVGACLPGSPLGTRRPLGHVRHRDVRGLIQHGAVELTLALLQPLHSALLQPLHLALLQQQQQLLRPQRDRRRRLRRR